MCLTVRSWSPVERRVVLCSALAEVSSWSALSWFSRSWYVAVMCLPSDSLSSLMFSVQVRLRCSLPCSTASLATASLSVSPYRPAAFAQGLPFSPRSFFTCSVGKRTRIYELFYGNTITVGAKRLRLYRSQGSLVNVMYDNVALSGARPCA